jgi:hypothetical protein
MLRFSVGAPLQECHRAFVQPWPFAAARMEVNNGNGLKSIQAKMKNLLAQADPVGADAMTTQLSIASKAERP